MSRDSNTARALYIRGLQAFGTLAVFTMPAMAHAGWRGDFESADLGQWSYLLNEAGLSVVSDPVLEGSHSGRVAIDETNLWSNGLNRVELQRKPDAALTADGSEVYFGWSLYVPEALTADDHQIGYWETDESYQQVMSLHAKGQDLTFNTNKPSYKEHWRGQGKLTPGTWHRIAYGIRWASASDGGRVSLWFDGELVVDQAIAQTYVEHPAFVQLGILRDTIKQVEVMFIDDAREGAALTDVQDTLAPPPAATSAPGEAMTGAPAPSAAPTAQTTAAAPLPTPSTPAATAEKDDSGCALRQASGGARSSSPWFLVAAFAVWVTRRRGRSRTP